MWGRWASALCFGQLRRKLPVSWWWGGGEGDEGDAEGGRTEE